MIEISAQYKKTLSDIESIAWFGKLGAFPGITMPLEIAFECDKGGAIKNILSDEWDEILLDRRNQLSEYLDTSYSKEYQEWNKIVGKAKIDLEDSLKKIEEALVSMDMPKELLPCISADLLFILIEAAFASYNPPKFFNCLLEIYQSGHIPIGWQGDSATGKLVVY